MTAEIIRMKMSGALRVVARGRQHEIHWLGSGQRPPQVILSSPYDQVASWAAEKMAAEHGLRILQAVRP